MKLVDHHNDTTYVSKFFWQVVAIHLVTILVAPFFFSVEALLWGVFFLFVFGYSMGIFHHMQLSHDSFSSKKWLTYLGSLLGTLTWRGPFAGPVRYVAMHKIHHRYSDTELDPHTPTKGIWFALMGWFWKMPYGFTKFELYQQYAPNQASDRVLAWMDRNVDALQVMWGIVSFLVGGFAFGAQGQVFDLRQATAFVIYGVFVRTLLSNYMINAVDVINHTIGYRNNETGDNSTNSFLMAAVHLGGAISWHNNHHAHPGYFTVKQRFWEWDAHYLALKLWQKLGFVGQIKVLDTTVTQKQSAWLPPVADRLALEGIEAGFYHDA